LKDRRSKNDKMPRKMQEVVETKAEEVRMAKEKGKKSRRKRTEKREEGKKRPRKERIIEIKRIVEK